MAAVLKGTASTPLGPAPTSMKVTWRPFAFVLGRFGQLERAHDFRPDRLGVVKAPEPRRASGELVARDPASGYRRSRAFSIGDWKRFETQDRPNLLALGILIVGAPYIQRPPLLKQRILSNASPRMLEGSSLHWYLVRRRCQRTRAAVAVNALFPR
jgi:hypothetical protein